MRAMRLSVGTPEPKHTPTHTEGPRVAFQLRDSEQVAIEVEALDSEQNPAAATTVLSSSDEDIVQVNDNGDGTALVIASPGAGGLGAATITARVTQKSTGDTIEGTFEIEVVAGDAVTVNVVPGTPEPKAETPATTPDGA
jgi:hypothetical protein